jgi:purine-binding chemotaxis protein CheW
MANYDKVVVFKLGNEEFATDIMQIERILDYEKCSKIPYAPPYVEGVINYEDRIMPVISLKIRLGLMDNGMPEESKIIVTKNNTDRLGLSVDYVEQVLTISNENVELPPEAIIGNDNSYIQGIIKLDGRIIILLDIEKLLTTKEIIEINSLY